MKGYAGHYGLERYKMFEALNLGSQVTNGIPKAVVGADVLLVSQTAPEECSCAESDELVELLRRKVFENASAHRRSRITHELAKELGCDAGLTGTCR